MTGENNPSDHIVIIGTHLTALQMIFTECYNLIVDNAILFTVFVASLVLIGFKIFSRAKRSSRS